MTSLNELLQETFAELDCSCAGSCEHNKGNAKSCIFCLSDQYFDENAIDYKCEQKRGVYILRYLPVHIQEVRQALDNLRDRDALPEEWPDPVRVLSIGGGPGTDIAAFKKFISENDFFDESSRNFEIWRLEKVKDWDRLAGKIIHLYKPDGFKFDHKLVHQDLNKLPQCVQGRFDVFLLSYIVSELSDAECARLGEAISALAGGRAIVIFNDRNQDIVWQKMQIVAAALNQVDSVKRTQEEWLGLSYPDALKDVTSPKLKMKSIRYGLIIQK